MNPDLLNNWKEIAAYLGRGVRTVQRWEEDLDMPVHRVHGTPRSCVTALKSELDFWMLHSPGREQNTGKNVTRDDLAQNRRILVQKRQKMRALMLRLMQVTQQTRDLLQKAGLVPRS